MLTLNQFLQHKEIDSILELFFVLQWDIEDFAEFKHIFCCNHLPKHWGEVVEDLPVEVAFLWDTLILTRTGLLWYEEVVVETEQLFDVNWVDRSSDA